MDPATMILLAKIVSDLILIITMGLPKTDGLTEEQKKAMLADLQAGTNKLVAELVAKATT